MFLCFVWYTAPEQLSRLVRSSPNQAPPVRRPPLSVDEDDENDDDEYDHHHQHHHFYHHHHEYHHDNHTCSVRATLEESPKER